MFSGIKGGGQTDTEDALLWGGMSYFSGKATLHSLFGHEWECLLSIGLLLHQIEKNRRLAE